jgi:hypothetical protein
LEGYISKKEMIDRGWTTKSINKKFPTPHFFDCFENESYYLTCKVFEIEDKVLKSNIINKTARLAQLNKFKTFLSRKGFKLECHCPFCGNLCENTTNYKEINIYNLKVAHVNSLAAKNHNDYIHLFSADKMELYTCPCSDYQIFRRPIVEQLEFAQIYISPPNHFICRWTYISGYKEINRTCLDSFYYCGRQVPNKYPMLYGNKVISKRLTVYNIMKCIIEFDKSYGIVLAKHKKELDNAENNKS